ncbi:GH36-type glycosyl hydrolase domain-containing protein [Acholeplasma laidlawii]|uniref:GH36-type glycosyl hydrolase domain-containing protein n=1 Tax=Acholeplasma laidlawii TaxID=2148 RepID=UPI003F8DB3E5
MKKKQWIKKNYGQYLPLYNLKQLKSSITPFFGGDIKTDHHHYLLEPTTENDLYDNHMSRNIIFTIDGEMYFLNGNTYLQQNDELHVEYDLLYQRVIRSNNLFSIESLSFIPLHDNLELLEVTIKNTSNKDVTVDVITAIPIYARSADNIRDHRHVTSLLNTVEINEQTVLVKPTLSFDERGHHLNHETYTVSAYSPTRKVNRIITSLEDFIDGGSFNFPKGIYKKDFKPKSGYEAIGGIGFEPFILKPEETATFNISMGIFNQNEDAINIINKYKTKKSVEEAFDQMRNYFETESSKLSISMVSKDVELLLRWVRFQPVLRRIFGNSYLPHHDYGRGGRGWRDLWQDLLSLILINDESVETLLFNNFQGIRIDGSNATIIGDNPGEFIADRNKIVRVWSDHGAWPLLTTLSYIHTTGHIDFLFKHQTYFHDQFTHYTNKTRDKETNDHVVRVDNNPYEGTILEHLLLQNIVAHFNTGKFGFVRLENADWNDGLDMAKNNGETIAFTHFYASNLRKIAEVIEKINRPVRLFKSLYDLIFETIHLNTFFDSVSDFKDTTVEVDAPKVSHQLVKLYKERVDHINKNAWINDTHLQSYITNNNVFLDTANTMNLTGQAMALLNETLSISQAKSVADTTKKLLFNKENGGYHLNSNYHKIMMDMGRAFGFSYNHKENGAVFSHMAIMYVYGLYNYNLVKLGNEGYKSLIMRAIHPEAHTILGIPEYFTDKGVGKYLYLTGSASWLLKLLQEQVFGITFNYGKLSLNPKLVKEDFINHKASIQTFIRGKLIKITYINLKNLDYGAYKIDKVLSKGQPIFIEDSNIESDIEVYLDEL